MLRKTILVAVSLLALAVTGQAHGQATCAPLEVIETGLAGNYGEHGLFVGKTASGIEYRLYLNVETGTWTFIGIPPGQQEIGCTAASGEGGRPYQPAVPPVKDNPT